MCNVAPVVSIAALIYGSVGYAAHLWAMVQRTVPELKTGEAEFFFVANDANRAVRWFLLAENIPHVVQTNPKLTQAELMARGIGKPEYIRRVYQGWNRAVLNATADCLVLLNSDHVLLPGWLDGLRERWYNEIALSPLTIEPGNGRPVFPRTLNGTGAIRGDWGGTLDTFNERGFEAHAAQLANEKVTPGGAFQPVMVSRQAVMRAGLYPEGNTHAGEFDRIAEYGDRRLFRVLREQGIEHHTYHGVVAYHFGEGEMSECQRSIHN